MKKLIIPIAIVLIIPIVLACLVAIVDPLQVYRKPSWYQPFLYANDVAQVAGVAKNYSYDTAIIGGEISANMPANYLKTEFELRPVNLAIKGSTAYEQYWTAAAAIDGGRVKNIIWELDYSAFQGDIKTMSKQNSSFRKYLYNNNPFDDLAYLLSPTQIANSFYVLAHLKSYDDNQSQVDIANWNNRYMPLTEDILGADAVREGFKSALDNGEFTPSDDMLNNFDSEKLQASFDANVLQLVKDNPDIKFYFWTPAYSVLEYIALEKQGLLENNLEFTKYSFIQLNSIKNVKFVDFRALYKLVTDFTLYTDYRHYTSEVAHTLTDLIWAGPKTGGSNFNKNQELLRELINTEAQNW
ncbi:MAG: hypothetical protein LBM38_03200 [Clostridiales bacterium]|jgi:hypothetical protein|nr:hypothetical protein [Clostridiales bacterium]